MAGRGVVGGRTGVPRLSAQRSVMTVEANPFEVAAATASSTMDMHVERLQDCVPISHDQFQSLLSKLRSLESNEERLKELETEKLPFLFTSAQLIALCEITTSLKTRLAMIKSIGPRLLDPRAETLKLTGMFRFAEEKNQVEDVLRQRFHAQQNTVFVRVETLVSGDTTTPTSTSGSNNDPTSPTTSNTSATGTAQRRLSNPLLGGRGGRGGGRLASGPPATTSTITSSNATAGGEEDDVGFGHGDIASSSTPPPLIEGDQDDDDNDDN